MEKEILNCKEKYPKRALLIINPVSGKKLVIRYIPDIIRRLMDSGYLVTKRRHLLRRRSDGDRRRSARTTILSAAPAGTERSTRSSPVLPQATRRIALGIHPLREHERLRLPRTGCQ